ncbi:MAG: hypothetical protein JRI23_35620 [Deltaproteobacteria bacterium]|jgi:hypothetical protein|nr:hypothetical protein [Deltaproteobacteria bacterium]MBW2537660.1 hypothetical protein [Deltaproteobacteria bacterium]
MASTSRACSTVFRLAVTLAVGSSLLLAACDAAILDPVRLAAGAGGEAGSSGGTGGDPAAGGYLGPESWSVGEGPDLGVERHPAIAASDQGYLASWTVGADSDFPEVGLRATLLDETGVVSSEPPLSLAERGVLRQAVASDGTDYLVVWTELDGESRQLRAARITSTGELLDPGGNLLDPAIGDVCEGLSLVWLSDGLEGRYLLTCRAEGFPALLVDRDGVVLGERDSVVTSEQSWGAPVVAVADDLALMAWGAGANTLAVRVDPSGAVLDPEPIVFASQQYLDALTAAWSGSEFFVAWGHGPGGQALGQWVDSDGTVGTGPWEQLGCPGERLTATRNGHGVLVASARGDQVELVTVERGVGALAAGVVTVPSRTDAEGGGVALASAGAEAVLVTARFENLETDWDVLATRLDADGAPFGEGPLPLARADASQLWPAVAVDEDGRWLAAFCDPAGASGWDVRIAMFDSQGNGAATVVAAQSEVECWPAVAENGDGFVVAWADDAGRVLARHVAIDGSSNGPVHVLGSANIDSDLYEVPELAAAWNGSVSMVVWADHSRDLQAVRLTPEGTPVDAPSISLGGRICSPLMSPRCVEPHDPAIAPDGDGFVVAYCRSSPSWPVGSAETVVSWVDSAGSVNRSRKAGLGCLPSAIALDRYGRHVLVGRAGDGPSLRAVRLEADGSAGADWELTTGPVEWPTISRDAAGLVVTWHDAGKLWTARLEGETATTPTLLATGTRRARAAGGLVLYEQETSIGGHRVYAKKLP